jgi:hypothetical protein
MQLQEKQNFLNQGKDAVFEVVLRMLRNRAVVEARVSRN